MGKMMLLGFGGLIAVIAAFKVFGALFGLALGLTAFLLFRVFPLVLIGWLVVRIWRRLQARPVD